MVWEETLALAPPGVRFVFLSATLPNATEFAGCVEGRRLLRALVLLIFYYDPPPSVWNGARGLHTLFCATLPFGFCVARVPLISLPSCAACLPLRWVARVHNQPCHVVYTDFRPTPLQHYVFPAGGDGAFSWEAVTRRLFSHSD